jgi:hypothetical protein
MELTICLIYGIATKINIREVGKDVGVALQDRSGNRNLSAADAQLLLSYVDRITYFKTQKDSWSATYSFRSFWLPRPSIKVS